MSQDQSAAICERLSWKAMQVLEFSDWALESMLVTARFYPVFVAFVVSILSKTIHAEIAFTIGQNFTGASYPVDSDAVPADANGAVGPDHFVEFVNGRFSVFNKQNALRIKTMTDRQFWINSGVSLSFNLDVTDPRIVFDRSSSRWFAIAVDLDETSNSGNRFLLAVSTSSNPAESWNGVAFQPMPGTGNFADFPTLGIDSSGIYLGADVFDSNDDNIGSTLVAIAKPPLLQNPPDIAGRTSFGVLSLTKYGDVLQPVVTLDETSLPQDVLAVSNVGLDNRPHSTLIGLTISDVTNTAALLGTAKTISTPSYRIPLNPVQPDGSNNLDDGDARFSSTVYRVGGILYGVHSTQVGARAAIQWFKINATNFNVIQTGIITDNELDLFYPSIAANQSGTVVIGCNGSSGTSFVSSYAMVGDTQTGSLVFGALQLLKAGVASYQNQDSGTSRWGDYSATSVDPADPDRFWTIQLYPSSDVAWSTQITEIITFPLRLTAVSGTNSITLSWPTTAVGFELQSRQNFSGGTGWIAVGETAVTNDNRLTVTLPTSGAESYFRLAKP